MKTKVTNSRGSKMSNQKAMEKVLAFQEEEKRVKSLIPRTKDVNKMREFLSSLDDPKKFLGDHFRHLMSAWLTGRNRKSVAKVIGEFGGRYEVACVMEWGKY